MPIIDTAKIKDKTVKGPSEEMEFPTKNEETLSVTEKPVESSGGSIKINNEKSAKKTVNVIITLVFIGIY